MKRTLSPLILVVVATLATACGNHPTNAVAPTSVVPAGGARASATGSLLGTWVSVAPVGLQSITTLPSLSTCGNFQWHVTSQTSTTASGQFSATCPGNLTVTGTITGQLGGATIPLTFIGAATQPGSANCAFSLAGTGYPLGNDAFRIEYTGTTCLGPVSGTETLRLASTPTTPTTGGLDSARIIGSPDVRGWPVTSEITSLVFGGGVIHIDHTKRGQWPPVVIAPDGTTQEATIWVFFQINGVWYGTGGERLRPGQTDKALDAPSHIGPGWLYDPSRWGPMANYVPRVGDPVGFMVVAGSTRSDDNAPVHERSSAVLIPFPSDGVTASFPPFVWHE